ncbi:hypothetical protein GY45DRAFT_207816 [Cubamyces sp. BRFM 1775]|nr:hypothetical protein GY45DRAFT_207816 [Cubamyces sp. BRFM 1775]
MPPPTSTPTPQIPAAVRVARVAAARHTTAQIMARRPPCAHVRPRPPPAQNASHALRLYPSRPHRPPRRTRARRTRRRRARPRPRPTRALRPARSASAGVAAATGTANAMGTVRAGNVITEASTVKGAESAGRGSARSGWRGIRALPTRRVACPRPPRRLPLLPMARRALGSRRWRIRAALAGSEALGPHDGGDGSGEAAARDALAGPPSTRPRLHRHRHRSTAVLTAHPLTPCTRKERERAAREEREER